MAYMPWRFKKYCESRNTTVASMTLALYTMTTPKPSKRHGQRREHDVHWAALEVLIAATAKRDGQPLESNHGLTSASLWARRSTADTKRSPRSA